MIKCEKCGKDFYSDTAFDEHQTFETLMENSKNLGVAIGNLIGNIQFGQAVSISLNMKISIDEAISMYAEWKRIWAYRVEEDYKKIKELT